MHLLQMDSPLRLYDDFCDAVKNIDWNRAGQIASDNGIMNTFGTACCNGNLEGVKWLVDAFPYIRLHNRFKNALRNACLSGQLNFVQWIWNTFPVYDITYQNDAALRYACQVGIELSFFQLDSDVICWLLSFYSAEKFWSNGVQTICQNFLIEWRAEVEPRRREFMTHIAPVLECRRAVVQK